MHFPFLEFNEFFVALYIACTAFVTTCSQYLTGGTQWKDGDVPDEWSRSGDRMGEQQPETVATRTPGEAVHWRVLSQVIRFSSNGLLKTPVRTKVCEASESWERTGLGKGTNPQEAFLRRETRVSEDGALVNSGSQQSSRQQTQL